MKYNIKHSIHFTTDSKNNMKYTYKEFDTNVMVHAGMCFSIIIKI